MVSNVATIWYVPVLVGVHAKPYFPYMSDVVVPRRVETPVESTSVNLIVTPTASFGFGFCM